MDKRIIGGISAGVTSVLLAGTAFIAGYHVGDDVGRKEVLTNPAALAQTAGEVVEEKTAEVADQLAAPAQEIAQAAENGLANAQAQIEELVDLSGLDPENSTGIRQYPPEISAPQAGQSVNQAVNDLSQGVQNFGNTLAIEADRAAEVVEDTGVVITIEAEKIANDLSEGLTDLAGGLGAAAGTAVNVIEEQTAAAKSEAQRIFEEAQQAFRRERGDRDTIREAARTYGYVPEGAAVAEAGANISYGAVAGPVYVIDPSHLEVSGRVVRISGIVGLDPNAMCFAADGNSYDCYNWALEGMRQWIDGKETTCALTIREMSTDAACEIPSADGTSLIDIGSWLVGAGIAVADPRGTGLYDAAQNTAREKQLGLWSGTFNYKGVSHP